MIDIKQIPNDLRTLYEITNTLWWEDSCGHGKNAYLFSFTTLLAGRDGT